MNRRCEKITGVEPMRFGVETGALIGGANVHTLPILWRSFTIYSGGCRARRKGQS